MTGSHEVVEYSGPLLESAGPILLAPGDTLDVTIEVGPIADPADVAAWLLAEARWWALQLGSVFVEEAGGEPIRHVLGASSGDESVDGLAPAWLELPTAGSGE